MDTQEIVLPPDIYDTYELSALVHGGIGGGSNHRLVTRKGKDRPVVTSVPNCQLGHRGWLSGEDMVEYARLDLSYYGIGIGTNDDAVRAINRRKGKAPGAPVTWREYTEQLRIVRGEVA